MHFKRLLSVVISMAITVSMIPVFVSADESEDAPSVTETTQAAEPSETETEATEPEETKPSESETEAAKPVETAPADDADKKDIGHSVKRKNIFDYSGDFGPNNKFHWDLNDETFVLTISIKSGTGAMPDYDNRFDTPWNFYQDYIKEVVIQSGITSVGSYAFFRCKEITKVTLPQGVKTIGFMLIRQ